MAAPQNPYHEEINTGVNRHHSSLQSMGQTLDVATTSKQKFADDFKDQKPNSYFEITKQANENMSVHDCNPGQKEDDDKSEYTYVSVSNISHNAG
jgi:hypothetical protein